MSTAPEKPKILQHPKTELDVLGNKPAMVNLKPDDAAARKAEIRSRFNNGLSLPNIIWIGGLHIGALAAPFFFTWAGLATMCVLWFITGCLGVTMGLHRMLTHRSFATFYPVRWFLALCGGLAGEGSAIAWVSTHRKHHALSDKLGDPHSPRDGAWWSHMLWLAPGHDSKTFPAYCKRWAPDLVEDRGLVFLDKTFLLWHWILGMALAITGYAIGGWYLATSLVVWGMFLRLTFGLHATWLVNSASHMWGYRNFATRDDSRNNWWVAAITFGEGWHNNHHAQPTMARHGRRWWEIDITYSLIRVMQFCGIAWNVVDNRNMKDLGHGEIVDEHEDEEAAA